MKDNYERTKERHARKGARSDVEDRLDCGKFKNEEDDRKRHPIQGCIGKEGQDAAPSPFSLYPVLSSI